MLDSITGLPYNKSPDSPVGEHNACSLVQQKTLSKPITCQGIGLHTGRKITMTLNPAEANAGINFLRSDIGGDGFVPASWKNVTETKLATTISNESGHHITTIEHLMAGFAGCGIDNALIEIDGPEVPAMDGSAQPFVTMIESSGVLFQDAPRKAILIKKPIKVGTKNSFISLMPASMFGVSFEIEFNNTALAKQSLEMKLVNGTFKDEIASARTFGFAHEVEAMQKVGLARGGSLKNAVVIEGDNVLNQEGLRYENEFVRHKILDCVGDLYLAGAPIIGQVSAVRSGHALNHELLCTLFSRSDSWCFSQLSGAVVPGTGTLSADTH
ncbi:MAG: UDP-3-O-acyl-N-acetylglucosamine deacetylase [Alphaproteobacteria bacterium]